MQPRVTKFSWNLIVKMLCCFVFFMCTFSCLEGYASLLERSYSDSTRVLPAIDVSDNPIAQQRVKEERTQEEAVLISLNNCLSSDSKSPKLENFLPMSHPLSPERALLTPQLFRSSSCPSDQTPMPPLPPPCLNAKRQLSYEKLSSQKHTRAISEQKSFAEIHGDLLSSTSSKQDISKLRKLSADRYVCSTYLEPLELVISQVRAILGECTQAEKEKAQKPCSPMLRRKKTLTLAFPASISPAHLTRGSPDDWHITNCLRRLNGVINTSVSYRYDPNGNDPAVHFREDLKTCRISVPWELIGIIGSAAYYAINNNRDDLQKMFYAATSDLIVDLRTFLKHLQRLRILEIRDFLYPLDHTTPHRR